MGRKLALFWSGLVLLAACQLAPQSGQGFQALGVLGGTPERSTQMGKVLDTAGANLSKEGEAFAGTLLPGMVVQVSGTDLGSSVRVTSLEVQVELKGPITSLDTTAGNLEVPGQRVLTNDSTRIYQKAGSTYRTLLLADLAVGDVVEVHGTATDSGVLATYIERYPATTQEVELEGQATDLDSTAKTFLLNGYLMDPSGAQVPGTPAEGAWAEVKGTLSGTTIQARKVESKTSGNSGYGALRRLELEGPIQALDETAKTFQLRGYLVTTTPTTHFEAHDRYLSQEDFFSLLQEGDRVEVKGTLSGGSIAAEKMELKGR